MTTRIWTMIPGTPNYASNDGLIAIFRNAYGGFATYWTFAATLPPRERKQRNAIAVGGLSESSAVQASTQDLILRNAKR